MYAQNSSALEPDKGASAAIKEKVTAIDCNKHCVALGWMLENPQRQKDLPVIPGSMARDAGRPGTAYNFRQAVLGLDAST